MRSDLAAITRSFGLDGRTVTDLAEIPELVEEYAKQGGAAVWDFPLSDLF